MRTSRFATCALLVGAALSAPAARAAAPVWSTDADQAYAEARRTGEPLLVDLYADWCGWCKTLAREVFPDPRFADAVKGFVLLRVDVDDGARGSELAELYHVESLPTLLALEPSGALEGEVRGYSPTAEYVQQIRAVGTIWQKVLEGYRQTLAASDQDRLRLTALDFYKRRDGERASKLLERLVAIGHLEGADGAWVRFFLADSLRMARDFAGARAALTRAAKAAEGVADPELTERLALFSFWIARDESRCAAAAAALGSFEHRHPKSELLQDARQALDDLRGGASTCS